MGAHPGTPRFPGLDTCSDGTAGNGRGTSRVSRDWIRRAMRKGSRQRFRGRLRGQAGTVAREWSRGSCQRRRRGRRTRLRRLRPGPGPPTRATCVAVGLLRRLSSGGPQTRGVPDQLRGELRPHVGPRPELSTSLSQGPAGPRATAERVWHLLAPEPPPPAGSTEPVALSAQDGHTLWARRRGAACVTAASSYKTAPLCLRVATC